MTPLPDWLDALPLPPEVAAKRRQGLDEAEEAIHAAARRKCKSVREAAQPRRICRSCRRSKLLAAFARDDETGQRSRTCRRCVRLAHEKEREA